MWKFERNKSRFTFYFIITKKCDIAIKQTHLFQAFSKTMYIQIMKMYLKVRNHYWNILYCNIYWYRITVQPYATSWTTLMHPWQIFKKCFTENHLTLHLFLNNQHYFKGLLHLRCHLFLKSPTAFLAVQRRPLVETIFNVTMFFPTTPARTQTYPNSKLRFVSFNRKSLHFEVHTWTGVRDRRDTS